MLSIWNGAELIELASLPAQSLTAPAAIVTPAPFVVVLLPKSSGEAPAASNPEVASVALKPAVCVPRHQPLSPADSQPPPPHPFPTRRSSVLIWNGAELIELASL